MSDESPQERDIRELRGIVATLNVTVATMTSQISTLEKQLERLAPQVTTLVTTLAEHKGSWKVVLGLMGTSGLFGGLIGEAIRHLK